jgi:hypothetical protein
MYYSKEVDLIDCNTVEEMVAKMTENEITDYFQIVENMAIHRNHILPKVKCENFKLEEEITIIKEGLPFKITVSCRYYNQPYTSGNFKVIKNTTTTPGVGNVLRRKNKKKNIDSLYLTVQDLNMSAELRKLKVIFQETITHNLRTDIANQLMKSRSLGIIDDNRRAELSLELAYEKTDKSNQYEFLKSNGFNGLDNLGVYTSKPDGYGHTCGRATKIDFRNKIVFVTGYSSDD